MWRWMKKNRWLALGLVAVMLFTLLPTNLNWADIAIGEPERASSETRPTETEDEKSEEITTEAVTAEVTTTETVTSSETTETVTETADSTTEAETVQGTTAEQNTVTEQSDTAVDIETTTEMDTETAATTEAVSKSAKKKNMEISQGSHEVVKATETGNVLDVADLDSMQLNASYVDDQGTEHQVSIDQNSGSIPEIPGDAKLSLLFDFKLKSGSETDCSKEYNYQLPPGIRVDNEWDLDLKDRTSNKVVGHVHISPSGVLTFTFDPDVIGDQGVVDFYVQFGGGFSDSLQESVGEHKLSFPTGSGSFDYTVDITEGKEKNPDKEPGDLGMSKSGYYVAQGSDGKPCIKWTISVNLNGRESVTGDITDQLPEGLTYKDGSLSGNYKGTVTPSVVDNKLTLHVENLAPEYQGNNYVQLEFETTYDEKLFGDKVTGNSVSVDNEAVINTKDDESATGTGNVWVQPHVLRKEGELNLNDQTIEWTVYINDDQFDIGGTTYTDTFGAGMELDGGITVDPAEAGNATSTGDGFTFTASPGFKSKVTLKYKTKITDGISESHTNTGKLTGDHYEVPTSYTVPGVDLLDKSFVSYNETTRTFIWKIVVNKAGVDLGDVTIKELLSKATLEKLKIDSVEIKGAEGTWNSSDNTITLNDVKSQVDITVVTSLTKEYEDQIKNGTEQWPNVKNTVEMEWKDKTYEDFDEKWFEYKEPDLLEKSGKFNSEDNTILWTLKVKGVNKPLEQKSFTITDTLPKEMEYVPGTFYLMHYEWSNWEGSTDMVKVDPTYDGNVLYYTVDEDNPSSTDTWYYENADGFVIQYKTRLKDECKNLASTEHEYTNKVESVAKYKNDYGADLEVTDTDVDTEKGTLGGILGKKALYTTSNAYVDWEVKVNESHFDMGTIKQAAIYDQLADYFTYVSGKLYRVKKDTNVEEKVNSNEYSIIIINGMLTVKLPENIGTDTFIFKFRTDFNVVSDSFLPPNTDIINKVDFKGEGISESVNSNEVDQVSFNSASAGSGVQNELWIYKVDANNESQFLPGAIFELYYDGVYCGTVETDANGKAVFKGILYSAEGVEYTIKEVQAPEGYELPKDPNTKFVASSAKLKHVNGTDCFELTIKNGSIEKDKQISLNVYKTDDDHQPLKEAEFTLYSDEDCTNAVATKKTDKDGKLSFIVNATEGTYYIKETKAPAGYVLDKNVYPVTINSDKTVSYGTNQVTIGAETALGIENKKIDCMLKLHKTDESNNPIENVSFGIYSDAGCNDLITKATTNSSGELQFNNLELGVTYYYREISAPSPYKVDPTIYAVRFEDNGSNSIVIEKTIVNNKALSSIEINKTDDSSPARTLANVTFDLYEADGTTPVKDPADPTKNYSVTTGSDGKAVFKDLPFGTYMVKENGAPKGYVQAADTKVTLDSTEGKAITIVNRKIKFNLKVVKTDNSTPAVPLEGVAFGLYKKNGSIFKSGRTGADGTLTFRDIPYDEAGYYIKETAGVKGYTVNSDSVPIEMKDVENGMTVERTIVNEKQNASISLMKAGTDKNKNPIDKLEGAVFTLYASDKSVVATAESDSNGIVKFEGLSWDTYTIRETRPPQGYILDNTTWAVEVNENTEYTEVYNLSDESQKFSTINNDELPESFDYVAFKLLKKDDSGKALQGARFTFSKRKGDSGDWTVLQTAESNADGEVEFYGIGIEKDTDNYQYKVEEIEPPYGYKLDSEYTSHIYTYQELTEYYEEGKAQVGYTKDHLRTDFSNSSVLEDGTYTNAQILGSIQILKKSLLGSKKLEGAEFTLYQRNAKNQWVAYMVGNKPYTVTTGSEGTAVFKDLPLGSYMVKETKAPDGYIINSVTGQQETELTENATTHEAKEVLLQFSDAEISVSINKLASDGTGAVHKALLAVYDGADLKEQWETDGSTHKLDSSKLQVGKTYTLKELKAPAGYITAPDVQFKIETDGSITKLNENGVVNGQTITMYDDKLELIIQKKDAEGNGLEGALLEVVDADGKSVYEFNSTGNKDIVPTSKLETPDKEGEYTYYSIHEKSAPDSNYALAEDIKIAIGYNGKIYKVEGDGSLTLANMPIVMTDTKKSGCYFAKVDASDTSRRIPGAKLKITNEKGESIAEWETTNQPRSVSLDPGARYYLEEVEAPKGYIRQNTKIKFEIANDGKITVLEGGAIAYLNNDGITLSMKDDRISVRVKKVNMDEQSLSGAEFDLYEWDASNKQKGTDVLQHFTSTLDYVEIDNSKLKLNGWYLLVETKAPEGYTVAEPVCFQIDNKGQVLVDNVPCTNNSIRIVDKYGDLIISKQDIGGNEIPDAEIKLQNEKGETLISWTSGTTPQGFKIVTSGVPNYARYELGPGNYTMVESGAPRGYAYAESITFHIDSTGKITLLDHNGKLLEDGKTLVMLDNAIGNVKISKKAVSGAEELPGAVITLYETDSNGNKTMIESWESGTEPHNVDGKMLKAGYRYTLHEDTAPAGYQTTTDIVFEIGSDGSVQKSSVNTNEDAEINEDEGLIVIRDKVEDGICSFSKQAVGGSSEIPGAIIELRQNGNIVTSWTSGESAKNFKIVQGTPDISKGELAPGEYTMVETGAPQGYAYAESITFSVDINGVITVTSSNGEVVEDGRKLIMRDNAIGNVLISKKAVSGADELPGATITLYEIDANGNETMIESWTSGTTPHEIDGKKLKAGYRYKLHEDAAPAGYQVTTDIFFEIGRDGSVQMSSVNTNTDAEIDVAGRQIVIRDKAEVGKKEEEKKDKKEEEETGTKTATKTDSKKTGDSAPIPLAGTLFFISLAGAGTAYGLRRKKARKK